MTDRAAMILRMSEAIGEATRVVLHSREANAMAKLDATSVVLKEQSHAE